MPVGCLDERAGRVEWGRFNMIGQRAGDESRAEVDSDGRKPNHCDAEKDAMRGVQ